MRIKHRQFDIILKPAAVLLIAMVLTYLGRTLLYAGGAAALSAFSAHRAVNDPLENGGFESTYISTGALLPHQVARVSGTLSTNWEDKSRWNDVAVDYSPDTDNPHGGKYCQKIEVKEVNNGTVKFCQGVRTEPGKTYMASIWLRASAPTTVTVGIRKLRATAYILSTDAQVTTEWQRVTVNVPVSKDPLVYMMLEVKEPVTIYVDDAAFLPNY